MAFDFKNNGIQAWKVYLGYLENVYGLSTNETILQPYTIAETVEWDNPDKIYFGQYVQNNLCNTVPVWGPITSVAGSAMTVVDGYQNFIDNISVEVTSKLTQEDIDKIKSKQQETITLLNQFNNLESSIANVWEDYYKNMIAGLVPQKTRTQFENERGYTQQKSLIKRQISDSQGEIRLIYNKKGGTAATLGNAISDFDNDSFQTLLPSSPDLDISNIDKNLWNTVRKQNVIFDVHKFLKEEDKHDITFTDKEERTETFEKHWGGSASVQVGWFNFSGGGGSSELSNKIANETNSLSISFTNLTEIRVDRQRWFRSDILKLYGGNQPQLWGENGLLKLVPVSYIIAKGTTVNVTATKFVVEKFEESWNGNAGVSFGPFHFGGGASSRKTSSFTKNTEDSCTVSDTSNRAKIIAVRCIKFHE